MLSHAQSGICYNMESMTKLVVCTRIYSISMESMVIQACAQNPCKNHRQLKSLKFLRFKQFLGPNLLQLGSNCLSFLKVTQTEVVLGCILR